MSAKYYIAVVDDFTAASNKFANVQHYDFAHFQNVTSLDHYGYDYRTSFDLIDRGDIDDF